MRKRKVKYSFVRFSTGELIAFSRSTVKKMEDSSYFPNPEVPLAELGEEIDQLEHDNKLSMNGGGRIATAKTHLSRIKVEDLLRLQADYVNKIAKGDEAIILSSGFEPTKLPSPSVRPVLRVISGNMPGQVIVKRQAVIGAHAYVWQYAKDEIPADDKEWIYASTTVQVKCTIDNLERLSNYWFRVAAIKRKGDAVWTKPVMKTIILS